MSLSSSISNALSGLSVTARAAQTVSSNLANALNENYSVQDTEFGSLRSGGTSVVELKRYVDVALLADRRNAQSEFGFTSEAASSARALEQAIGSLDDSDSILSLVNNFDTSLRYLESDPSSEVRLMDTVSNARALSQSLQMAENHIQKERLYADGQIETAVQSLNEDLNQIVALNRQIVASNLNGREVNSMLDQRQALIDQVSELVPLREMSRRNGAVSLVTANGTMLIDDSAMIFDFESANTILPHMSIENDQLGALMSDGVEIDISSDSSALSGGRMQALFEIRDQLATEAQSQIDTFALDLAERFQELPSNVSTTSGATGLFTDGGLRVEASNQTGLAGRLEVHENVDPEQGGEIWRLQSGMNALSMSNSGDATVVTEMIASLELQRSSAGTLFEHVADLASVAAQISSELEQKESFASAQFEQLTQLKLQDGVDTDVELQKLLSIENNYAANAKVLQAIDEMFAAIMGIN